MKEARSYTVTGLMSGTSLDGTDLALCEFSRNLNRWEYRILFAETVAYPGELRHRLEQARYSRAEDLIQLDTDLGRYYGRIINDFHLRAGQNPDFIASHGHTIFHQPDKGFTFQAGKGEAICLQTGLTVISDFRSRDILLGGQGAPLVPIGDELLFPEYSCCLNLGGIANLSYSNGEKRLAFDICPINMALNFLAGQKGLSYDNDGALAASGKADPVLLSQINALPYFQQTGPRSLGAEWFDHYYLPLLEQSAISTEDKLATVCKQSAEKIASQVEVFRNGSLLITGGGAHNRHLVGLIRETTRMEVIVPEKELVDYKEALIFAFLGLLRIRNEINCLSAVTGASSDSCTGVVYNPQNIL